MAIQFECPCCGQKLQGPDSVTASKIDCPKCRFRFKPQPRGDQTLAAAPPLRSLGEGAAQLQRDAGPHSMVGFGATRAKASTVAPKKKVSLQIKPPDVRFNLLAAIGWVCVAGLVANSASFLTVMLGGLDAVVMLIMAGGTIGFIVWNAWSSLLIIAYTGRTRWALPLTGVQLVLFTFLFIQIRSHGGSHHFVTERAPQLWDWIAFSVAHAFRGADVIDTLQAYGLHIQMIRPSTPTAGWALAAFRGVIDLFFLKVFLDFLAKIKEQLGETLGVKHWGSRVFVPAFGVFVVVWLVSALVIRPWPHKIDLLLWPLENILRVIDFPDAMEIYDLRLTRVPQVPWESTLAILFRFFVALAVAGLVEKAWSRITLQSFRGLGLREQELRELLREHPSGPIHEIAQERLELIAQGREITVQTVYRAWTSEKWNLVAGAAATLGLVLLILSSLRDPSSYPISCLGGENEIREQRALLALRRLGISASRHLAELDELQQRLPKPRRLLIIETMGDLGPAAIDHLGKALSDQDTDVACAAAASLGRQGSPAAALLADRGLLSANERIRLVARESLLAMGQSGVQALVDSLSDENAHVRIQLLTQLDPSWHLLSSTNGTFQRIAVHHRALHVLSNPASTPEQLSAAVAGLQDQGSALAPLLWGHLLNSQGAARENLAAAMVNWKSTAASFVANRLSSDSEAESQLAGDLLLRMGIDASPYLVELLGATEPASSKAAALLGKQGVAAGPALVAGLQSQNNVIAAKSIDLLISCGPPAVNFVGPLLTSSDMRIRDGAVSVVHEVGPAAAVPLSELVRHQDPSIAQAAFQLLSAIAPSHLSSAEHARTNGLIAAAQKALTDGDPAKAETLLSQVPKQSRKWVWWCTANNLRGVKTNSLPCETEGGMEQLVFDDDGEKLLLLWGKHQTVTWQISDGQVVTGEKERSPEEWMQLWKAAQPPEYDVGLLMQTFTHMPELQYAIYVYPGPRVLAGNTRELALFTVEGNKLASVPLPTQLLGHDRTSGSMAVASGATLKILRPDMSISNEFAVPVQPNVGFHWSGVHFSPGGHYVLAINDNPANQSAYLCNLSANSLSPLTSDDIVCHAFSPVDDVLVLGTKRSTPKIYDLATSAHIGNVAVGPVQYMRFNRWGDRMAFRTPWSVEISSHSVTPAITSLPSAQFDVLAALLAQLDSVSDANVQALQQAVLGLGESAFARILEQSGTSRWTHPERLDQVIHKFSEQYPAELARQVATDEDVQQISKRTMSRLSAAAGAELIRSLLRKTDPPLDYMRELCLMLAEPPRQQLIAEATSQKPERRQWATELLRQLDNDSPSPNALAQSLPQFLTRAAEAWQAGRSEEATDILNSVPEELRAFEWNLLLRTIKSEPPLIIRFPAEEEVMGPRLSPGDRFLVARRKKARLTPGVQAWDATTGKEVYWTAWNTEYNSMLKEVTSIDGTKGVLSVPALGLVTNSKGDLLATALAGEHYPSFAFAANRLLVCVNQEIRSIDLQSPAPPPTLRRSSSKTARTPKSRPPKSAPFDIASLDFNRWHGLTIWDANQGNQLRGISAEEHGKLLSPAFSPSGKLIAVVTEDNGEAIIVDTYEGKVSSKFRVTGGKNLCFLDENRLFVHSKRFGAVYDLEKAQEVVQLEGFWDYAPLAKRLFVSGQEQVSAIDIRDGTAVAQWKVQQGPISVNPAGTRFVTKGNSDQPFITFWSFQHSEPLLQHPLQRLPADELRFSDDGSKLLVVCDDHMLVFSGVRME